MTEIKSKPATKEYRDNWDTVFGSPKRWTVEDLPEEAEELYKALDEMKKEYWSISVGRK